MSATQSAASAHAFYAATLLLQRDVPGAHRRSLEVGAWLCLREAWYAWLKELYQLATPKGKLTGSLANIEELSAQLGDQHPEIQRLINLQSSPSSWITCMLGVFERADFPMVFLEPPQKPETAADNGLIPLNALGDDQAVDIREVLQNFRSYMDEVRAHMLEW